ncbi:MAG: methionine synthase [Candidatus Omnitrophica bacterium]|nr:methionine synthase [Candidatus Omnitrophota bacterium]
MLAEKFEPIIVELPVRQIYSRLGYVNNKTWLSDKQQKQINDYIAQAEALIELKGLAMVLDIKQINQSKISFSNELMVKSNSLAKLLLNSSQALFMGATSGQAITQAISKNSENHGDMTQAVVFDAVASEMTDAALDWLVNYYNNTMRRQNKTLTKRRFSAGYGDFGIENQKLIFDVLNMKQLGVEITDSFLLVPEKSVTAIAGIGQIIA